MAILEIVTVPNPVLKKRARPVRAGEFGPAFERLVSDMAETMYSAPGVGLAAPQVGDSRQFLVADPGNEDGEGPRGREFLVLVNPRIVDTAKETVLYEEGCLSVPDMWETFQRPAWARVRWLDQYGREHEQVFHDYAGVVIQHEIDHLEGVLILDRVSRLKRSRYLRARKKALAEER